MTPHDALTELLHARHSCRAFRPDPVPRDVIETILTDAGRAASWCNAQPWKIYLTSGDQTEAFRTTMLDAFDTKSSSCDFDPPTGYTGAHLERRRTCGMQLYDAVGIGRGDRAARSAQMRENYRFFGAPHVALIASAGELGTYGALDCGGFITSFCLSAQSQGIATIPQAALAFYANEVRAFFDIPEDFKVLAAISFGYADTDHPANQFRTERAPLDDLVTWRG
ncbi:nitroreductase [Shimia aestuarii]|uniref:Nitroreductase n=1 Tax=Shimia aestuarii TaxID=254406 RepID=A0A1I4IZA0_9RHOB|nr:nitroreductase [Shimia aestuarii]SFL59191.1 Nitroreductase [Shimia aestuarii]